MKARNGHRYSSRVAGILANFIMISRPVFNVS